MFFSFSFLYSTLKKSSDFFQTTPSFSSGVRVTGAVFCFDARRPRPLWFAASCRSVSRTKTLFVWRDATAGRKEGGRLTFSFSACSPRFILSQLFLNYIPVPPSLSSLPLARLVSLCVYLPSSRSSVTALASGSAHTASFLDWPVRLLECAGPTQMTSLESDNLRGGLSSPPAAAAGFVSSHFDKRRNRVERLTPAISKMAERPREMSRSVEGTLSEITRVRERERWIRKPQIWSVTPGYGARSTAEI